MKISFETLIPSLKPWVEGLVNVWPANAIKSQFASWEVLHILSLVLLGGTSIILNLRLIGVGMTEEAPSEIYRNLRRWQDLGVVGIVITGLLIGMANAERLYGSTAFLVKIIALIAGIVLTYGASRPVARADGVVSGRARLALAIGLSIWLFGVAIFATGELINPGLLHVVLAAGLIIALLTHGRLRWVYVAVTLLLLAAQLAITHFLVEPFDIAKLDPINKSFAWGLAAWTFAVAALQLRTTDKDPWLAKVVGYASILVWVTAAAAGRWIAFA